tara:strand:- start:281 stop:856 length:576 start_codon:yes stop_codon:yes gene_type:complete
MSLKNHGDEKEPLYRAKDVQKLMNMKNIQQNLKYFNRDEKIIQKVLNTDRNGVKKSRQNTFLTLKGLKRVINSSRTKPPIELIKLLEIDVHDTWFSSIEASVIDKIMTIFPTEKFTKQFYKDGYKIDLYHVQKNIAIEIDENNHKTYDIIKERERTEILTNSLNPTWIRFNANDPDSFYDKFGEIYKSLTT